MPRKPQQMPFDLGHASGYAPEDFRRSPCNREAADWIDKWPDWPAPALIIYGPPASGKTHLAHIWRAKAKAVILSAAKDLGSIGEGEDPSATPQDDTSFIIDGVEKFIGNVAQEEKLFHLYNTLKETGGHMLITAETPPREWPFVLADLKSRLLAAPSVALQSPDDELMAIVLSKMFSDRQIFVPQEVIAFILPRMQRSFAAARDLADKIDRKALAEKRPVTVPLVRDVMQEGAGELPL